MSPSYVRVYDEGAKRHYSVVVGSSDAPSETVKVVDDTPGEWAPPTDVNDRPLDPYGNPVDEPAPALPLSASKAEWVAHAVSLGVIPADEAESKTKAELQELVDKKENI